MSDGAQVVLAPAPRVGAAGRRLMRLLEIVAVVPWMIGVSASTEIRTRTNCGDLGSSAICSILPVVTPLKVTVEPFASPSTELLKKMS